MSRVLLDWEAATAIVTLQRPEKRNALDEDMLRLFESTVVRAAGDPRIRALIVRGDGPVFCAGADLAAFRALDGPADRERWCELGRRAFGALREAPVPVLVAITGGAFGGGVELALHGDLRFLSRDAVLCMPEVTLGWTPDWDGLDLLPALVGPARAAEILLTGRRIGADEAVRVGLASESVDDPDQRAREVAAALADVPASVSETVLRSLRPRISRGGWKERT